MAKTSSYCVKTTPKRFVPPPPSAWLKLFPPPPLFVGVKLHMPPPLPFCSTLLPIISDQSLILPSPASMLVDPGLSVIRWHQDINPGEVVRSGLRFLNQYGRRKLAANPSASWISFLISLADEKEVRVSNKLSEASFGRKGLVINYRKGGGGFI